MRYDLEVPFEEKDEARGLGARWDSTKKVWYMDRRIKELEKYLPVYLFVPFEEKDEVKMMGARWNNEFKKWVIPDYRKDDFEKWLLENLTFVDIPFDLKDDAKELGGKWDSFKKLWYFEGKVPYMFAEYVVYNNF